MPGYDPQEGDRISPVPPVGEPRGMRRLVRLAAMDLGPLRRRRDFRLLFVGQGLSFFGSMLTYVAIPYQAYDLTGSTLVLGLLAAVELPPILVAAFVGGALADAVDRRRLVQLAELGLMACTALLLVNAGSHRRGDRLGRRDYGARPRRRSGSPASRSPSPGRATW